MNIIDLLKELEESFPDRLPIRSKLGAEPLEDLYVRVGQQEVIRKIRGLINMRKTDG